MEGNIYTKDGYILFNKIGKTYSFIHHTKYGISKKETTKKADFNDILLSFVHDELKVKHMVNYVNEVLKIK